MTTEEIIARCAKHNWYIALHKEFDKYLNFLLLPLTKPVFLL